MSRGICRMPYNLTVAYFKDTELQKCPGESTFRLIFQGVLPPGLHLNIHDRLPRGLYLNIQDRLSAS